MAVSGRRSNQDDWSMSKGCDEDFEFDCDPCSHDGNFVQAVGYCINCEDYLCLSCLSIHCKPTPLKNHVLLDQNNMPKQKPRRQPKQVCTEMCTDHPNEAIKFYCSDHDTVGCSDCIVLCHKTCKVDYIPTVSEEYGSSVEYTAIVQNLKDSLDEITTLTTETDKDFKQANIDIDKALSDIKQRRQIVNDFLDKAEKVLVDKCTEMKTSNQNEFDKVQHDLAEQTNEVLAMQTQLSSNLNMTADLFVRSKQSRVKIGDICKILDVLKEAKFRTLKFKTGADLMQANTANNILGELDEAGIINDVTDISLCLRTLIKVKSNREKTCYITGMVAIGTDRIVCTDWINFNVKIVDINRNKIIDKILVDQAWDITAISKDKLAVTCPDKTKIQFLDMKTSLAKSGTIGVDGKCRGIDCIRDTLAVSYIYPPKVEIMNLSGTVLRLITADVHGKPLFLTPFYIAFSHDCKSIFVSDDETHTIFKITLDGRESASCKNQGILNPRGMFVCEDGRVIVGSSTCPKVFAMSSDCRRVKTLLSGFFMHKAVCAIEDRNTVVLSNGLSGPHELEGEIGLYNVHRDGGQP